jgi:hypothetical protein
MIVVDYAELTWEVIDREDERSAESVGATEGRQFPVCPLTA